MIAIQYAVIMAFPLFIYLYLIFILLFVANRIYNDDGKKWKDIMLFARYAVVS